MGEFIITAPDGKKYKVTGDNAEGAVAALKKMLGQGATQPQEEVVATTKDGGRVVKTAKGLAFTSPGYATTDPDAIARIMEGATPAAQSMSGFDRSAIEQAPMASRAAKFLQGVPFLGEYVDEAAGMIAGGDATRNIRAVQGAMDRERPKESTALQIGGGIAGTIPAAMSAVASLPTAAMTLGQKALIGAGVGALTGGVEGAVSGYGAGNDGDRGRSALERGALGFSLGGALGGLAPAVAQGASSVFQRVKGTDIRAIGEAFGISPDAARVVKTALENDNFDAARAAIERAGGRAMLADAGPGAQNLLDATVTYGGKAPRIVREAVDERAAAAGRDMQGALDATLGGPQGQAALSGQIRANSAGARSAAYDAAYAAPIDYSAPKGLTLESLLKRAPAAAVKRANELMRLEGAESAQIMASIGDDGAVSFTRMPDVRQIDYITRALNDVADAANGQGKLGGTTDLGRAYGNLSRAIRGTLKGLVPEYGQALDVAADAISQRKAVDLGYDLLRPSTRRETVVEGLRGASKSEVEAAKQGLRSYIDDTLANVKASITSPDADINEFRKLAGDLRSRASRAKIATVLGPKEAAQLFDTLDENLTALELRAAIAMNSKTAQRQGIKGTLDAATAPGALGTLMQGEPVNATRRVIQLFTGQTPEMTALRQQGILDEIAQALTGIRGEAAKRALETVQDAMNGQPVTEAQARLIGRVLGATVAVGGYQTGMQSISSK